MALTYQLIASNTLTSSAASVTFSSIPGTYTDLVLKVSARTDRPSLNIDGINIGLNNSSTSFSHNYLRGDGATASSGSGSTNSVTRTLDGSTSTANTFGTLEVYIPSYTASQNKPFSFFGVSEENATTAYINAYAFLWRDTSAVTSLVLTPSTGPNFVSGSTFWLYGIKKD